MLGDRPVMLKEVAPGTKLSVPPNAAKDAVSGETLEILRPFGPETEKVAEPTNALDPDGLSFVSVSVTLVESVPSTIVLRLTCLVWALLAAKPGSANAATAPSVIAKTRTSNLRMLVMLNLPV